jgi:methane monooxygenase PmoA-like/3-keto-disaccharide hydrolase
VKKVLLALSIASVSVSYAQVKLTKEADRVRVEINGQPFSELHFSPDVAKPYLYPLRSASGKIVTRQWPMVKDLGETTDHQHHRGLWLGYIDVNGTNFWESEFTYNRPNGGRIVTRKVDVSGSGRRVASVHYTSDWLNHAGDKVLVEDSTLTFSGDTALRFVDFDCTLTAAVKAVFGDDKDGAFGYRIADKLTEKTGTGVITNSAGQRTMKEAWGKPADWLDYSGTLDGEPVGIAVFEHPSSFHHPTRWHARDYGLVSANPFADHAYDPSQPVRNFTLNPGETVHLRYRIVVHGKMDAAGLQKLYDAWTANHDLGFQDTPMLPGLPFHVHDDRRPHPRVVTAANEPGAPPSDAIVLFNGKDLSAWTSHFGDSSHAGTNGAPPEWKVADGYVEAVPRTGDIATKEKFGDCQLHVEWASPAEIQGRSQSRGNSGVILMSRYEIQVLDSYNNPTYADGQAGAIYGQWPPLVNPARKPGEWQSYDIVFEAPRFEGDKLAKPAYFTVFLNGVLLHNHQASMGPMVYRDVAHYTPHPAEDSLVLQNHNSKVRYRNIWVRRLGRYDEPEVATR